MEEARKALKDRVQHLAPYEIAIIEQEMVEETEDDCIRKIFKYAGGLQDVLLTKDEASEKSSHLIVGKMPKMKELLLSVEDLVQYPLIKNQWNYEDLLKLDSFGQAKPIIPSFGEKNFTRLHHHVD